MKNKKGFVMTETLVVTVFLVTVFTFVYVSIMPLLGIYEGKIEKDNNIDVLYELYHLRKLLKSDANKNNIVDGVVKSISCDNFSKKNLCIDITRFFELAKYNQSGSTYTLTEKNYELYYIPDIYEYLNIYRVNNPTLNADLDEYLKKYDKEEGAILALVDLKTQAIGHLLIDPPA